MDSGIHKTLALGDKLPALIEQKQLAQFVATTYGDMVLSHELPRWRAQGMPEYVQQFIELQCRQTALGAVRAGCSLVLGFINRSKDDPSQREAWKDQALSSLHAELAEHMGSVLAAEAINKAAKRDEVAPAETPAASAPSAQMPGEAAPSTSAGAHKVGPGVFEKVAVGDAPIHDICASFLKKSVAEGVLTQVLADQLQLSFYSAMVTIIMNFLHAMERGANNESAYQKLCSDMMAEAGKASGRPDVANLEWAARGVH